jgi:hypothetical protein
MDNIYRIVIGVSLPDGYVLISCHLQHERNQRDLSRERIALGLLRYSAPTLDASSGMGKRLFAMIDWADGPTQ